MGYGSLLLDTTHSLLPAENHSAVLIVDKVKHNLAFIVCNVLQQPLCSFNMHNRALQFSSYTSVWFAKCDKMNEILDNLMLNN